MSDISYVGDSDEKPIHLEIMIGGPAYSMTVELPRNAPAAQVFIGRGVIEVRLLEEPGGKMIESYLTPLAFTEARRRDP